MAEDMDICLNITTIAVPGKKVSVYARVVG